MTLRRILIAIAVLVVVIAWTFIGPALTGDGNGGGDGSEVGSAVLKSVPKTTINHSADVDGIRSYWPTSRKGVRVLRAN